MKNLLDFYLDSAGVKWTPKYGTDSIVYCKGTYGPNQNNISHACFMVEGGHLDPDRKVYKSLDGQQCEIFVRNYDKEQPRPENFVPSFVREKL